MAWDHAGASLRKGTTMLHDAVHRSTLGWRASARVLLVLTMTFVAISALPGTASATGIDPNCPSHLTDQSCNPGDAARVAGLQHVGWTYLNLNFCPSKMACMAVYRSSAPAYRWTYKGWLQTSIRQGSAYVYPYSGQWRWA